MSSVSYSSSRLETESVGKLLWQYSLPAIVGTLVNSMYTIIDRIFIGHGVGPLAISGLALTFPVFLMLQAFGMLIGAGSSARISIFLGQKNKAAAEKVLGNALIMALILMIPIVVLPLIFLEDILRAFGGSDQTIPYAKSFLTILIPGNILSVISFGFNNIMRASGYPKKAMYTMLIGAATNIVLDAIFIFGFKWGIQGAAIATLISMGVSAVWVLSHFFNPEHTIHFKKGIFRLEWKIMLSILSIGMSPFIMQLTASFVNVLINNSLKKFGGDFAVGAYGIVGSCAAIIIMFIIGLNQGMQPIAGYNYGAKRMDRVSKVLKYAIFVATIVSSLGAISALLIPEWIVKAFTTDPELVAIAANGLRIMFSCFFLVGSQMVIITFFQSIGLAGKSIFLSMTRQCLILIPCILILPRFFQLNGVWMAGPVSDSISFLITISYLIVQLRKFKTQGTAG